MVIDIGAQFYMKPIYKVAIPYKYTGKFLNGAAYRSLKGAIAVSLLSAPSP